MTGGGVTLWRVVYVDAETGDRVVETRHNGEPMRATSAYLVAARIALAGGLDRLAVERFDYDRGRWVPDAPPDPDGAAAAAAFIVEAGHELQQRRHLPGGDE